MKKELYYTPSIDEFHVGFEFEMLEYNYEGNDYYPSIFGNLLINNNGSQYTTEIKTYVTYIKNEHVRVKYLDKEDLESLGFFYYSKFEGHYEEWHFDVKSNIKLTLYLKSDLPFISIYKKHNCSIFAGTIKNKSELKVLLKQLNIIE